MHNALHQQFRSYVSRVCKSAEPPWPRSRRTSVHHPVRLTDNQTLGNPSHGFRPESVLTKCATHSKW